MSNDQINVYARQPLFIGCFSLTRDDEAFTEVSTIVEMKQDKGSDVITLTRDDGVTIGYHNSDIHVFFHAIAEAKKTTPGIPMIDLSNGGYNRLKTAFEAAQKPKQEKSAPKGAIITIPSRLAATTTGPS